MGAVSEPTTQVVGESWLRTVAKTVCIILLGLFAMQHALAQLDPSDPWPKYGRDERNSLYSPSRGPHIQPILRWVASLTPSMPTAAWLRVYFGME